MRRITDEAAHLFLFRFCFLHGFLQLRHHGVHGVRELANLSLTGPAGDAA